MVPIRSSVLIGGVPVSKFLDEGTLSAIETRTRKAGGEVVGLLGFGSAFVSPAWAALEMAEAIIYDKRKVIAVCALTVSSSVCRPSSAPTVLKRSSRSI